MRPLDYGFELDAFQRRAIDALDSGTSVLVAAPTGAGKTVIAEHAVERALAEGGKAFYTTPIKALSNQKFGDLVRRYGAARVGLLTGDNSINSSADAVVMTTEVLRNMIYASSPLLQGLRFVVLDEVHYLQDTYRGPVWEEVIIHAAPSVQLVCLSATVSNAEEVAEWLTTVRGPTTLVLEEERPVELRNLYLVGDRSSDALHLLPTLLDGRPNPEAARLDAASRTQIRGYRRQPARSRHGYGPRDRGSRGRSRYFTPRRPEVIELLAERGMLPALYFIFSRMGCEEAVESCIRSGLRLTSPEERARVREIAEEHTAVLTDDDLDVLDYDTWLAALEAGIAPHHAGMVPAFKETVEACFVEGLIKAVFATETLALGINMPARSVVIERLTKFGGQARTFLTPGEYTQLAGRAGRRGIDDRGYAIVLWSRFVPFDQVASLASSRTYALRSAFRPTYNMAANLVRRYQPADAHHLLNLSLAQFQTDQAVVRIEARIEHAETRLASARSRAQCERGDVAEFRAHYRATDREDEHPVAVCPERERHLKALAKAERTERELARLRRQVRSRTESLARRFDRVLRLLETWGYLDGWALTDRGSVLARTYHESDLLVAEAMCSGLLDDLDPPTLAGLTSTFTYEHRGPTPSPPPWFPSGLARRRWADIEQLASQIAADEEAAGLPITRPPDPGFLGLAHAWAAGEALGEILGEEELSGGDFVRNIKTLIDLLRQMGEVAPTLGTSQAARHAAERLHRGVVAASSSLDEAVDDAAGHAVGDALGDTGSTPSTVAPIFQSPEQ
jgi:ATP-dependent RNA helicase HelY